jgi:serine phosphatase RsbU (regulator of sigma subunit)
MTQVGGDFYDYCLPGDGRVGVLIADISGHGVPAALIAAMAKIAFANQREHAAHPDRVLDGIHRMLSEKIDSNFITAGYAWIDRPQLLLRCAGAGHPPLLLYRRATGETHELKPAGSLIGWMTRADCAVEETTLEPGDRIILYTDGILEAADTADEEYGETRFHALIGQTADEPAQLLIERLFAEIRDWTGREQLDDDLTIVVIDVV